MPKSIACDRWICGVCRKEQKHSGSRCRDCRSEKCRGESLVVLRGDWTCKECGTNNFARRAACYKCRKDKNEPAHSR